MQPELIGEPAEDAAVRLRVGCPGPCLCRGYGTLQVAALRPLYCQPDPASALLGNQPQVLGQRVLILVGQQPTGELATQGDTKLQHPLGQLGLRSVGAQRLKLGERRHLMAAAEQAVRPQVACLVVAWHQLKHLVELSQRQLDVAGGDVGLGILDQPVLV